MAYTGVVMTAQTRWRRRIGGLGDLRRRLKPALSLSCRTSLVCSIWTADIAWCTAAAAEAAASGISPDWKPKATGAFRSPTEKLPAYTDPGCLGNTPLNCEDGAPMPDIWPPF